ncbi:MAG TPA: preprotein translocase subunit SecE [Terriglobales bacterium]|nr:preprotein translocase subunit SecE [Terriglobales bacterium]
MAKSEAVRLMEENGAVGKVRSWPARIKSFYTDVRTEMKKVSTPSRKEVQATTMVVIIAVFLFGVYFFIIDSILGRAIERLFRSFQ